MENGFYRKSPDRHTSGLEEPLALRPRQAAAAIGVSEKTLERLTDAGAIPCVRMYPPTATKRQRAIVVYEVAALREYLASSRRAGEEVTA